MSQKGAHMETEQSVSERESASHLVTLARKSLDKIGEGDWTPQDVMLARVTASLEAQTEAREKAERALRYLVNGLEVVGGEVRVCQLPAAITPEGLREVRALAALRFDYAAIESEREKLEAAREHDRAMIELWREQRVRLAAVFADAVRDCPDRAHWLGLWNEALEPAALSQATKREAPNVLAPAPNVFPPFQGEPTPGDIPPATKREDG